MSPNVELELERVCEYASALSADANLTFNSESAFIHLSVRRTTKCRVSLRRAKVSSILVH